MASSPTSIPERGQLRETPLPRILLELYHSRFEGHLHLTRDRVEKKISLRQGAPVASTSNLSGESLGAQLLESGKLSRVDQAKVDSYIEQQGCEERRSSCGGRFWTASGGPMAAISCWAMVRSQRGPRPSAPIPIDWYRRA